MSLKKSNSISELSKALTKFQKATPKVTKSKKGKIELRNGGSYEYDYADLASIWDSIRGSLADCELAVVQSPTTLSGEPALTGMLSHSSGEWLEDTMPLKIVQETPQGQGSAITYARRYQLCAMLGIVADSDNDAVDHRTLNGVQKKQLFDTARKIVPELGEDKIGMVRFLAEIVGKHPNRILESEFDDAIASVESYTKESLSE